MRELGKYVEDPRIGRNLFVHAACCGDVAELNIALDRGEDVNAIDSAQCTGMHHAAANGHVVVMTILHENGGKIDSRDRNLEVGSIDR